MPTFSCVLLDVFTDVALEGNQLAVFPDAGGMAESVLQPLAREIGFSETVYVVAPTDPSAEVRARIFTPAVELPFAGHPVLGTGFVMASRLGLEEIILETGAGLVPVSFFTTDDGRRHGRMSQPVPTVEPLDDDTATAVLAALGVDQSGLPVEVYDNGIRHAYVTLADSAAVAGLRPDLGALAGAAGTMGVSTIADEGLRWKTRMFCPGAGVAEDPATGSAAGPLAVHLCRHGRVLWGEQVEISQGAELNRPSTLYARAEGGDTGPTKVEVAGGAVVVGHATFDL